MTPLVVFFDFGGTLDADGIPWGVRFHASHLAAGGTLEFPGFEPLFRNSDRALAQLPGIEQMGFQQMIEAQARLLVEALPEPERAAVDADRLAANFHAAARAGITRNIPLLARLATTARLGVISNYCGNLERCLAELGISRFFEAVVDSGALGASKPDPAIFTAAMAMMSVASRDCWMVGDNFEADIRPAARLGMSTAWIAPAARALPAGCVPTARLSNLGDLAGVLKVAGCTR